MKKLQVWIKEYIPRSSCVMLAVMLVSLAVYFAAILSESFADFVNRTLGWAVRLILSLVTYILPFSLFEALVIIALPLVACVVVFAFRATPTLRLAVRNIALAVSVVGILLSSYIFTLGVGYRTQALDARLGLVADEPSEEELISVSTLVVSEINSLSASLGLSGQSEMGYDIDTLSRKLVASYSSLSEELGFFTNFPTRIKPIVFSGVMSDAKITGIYSFFTGESNLNTAYPDYSIPFTVAHEFAHQRGFARENEANFIAYLVCIGSSDEYIRYSGYLSMYEYLASALYRTNPDAYYEVAAGLVESARADILAAREVNDRHADSLLGTLTDKANDNYLKLNGTEGMVSYGLVVRLAVAYYEK